MYNAEQKSQFVKEYTTSIAVRDEAMRMFNALEPFEERSGTDLCAMNENEIRLALENQMGVRNRSGHLRLNILREYGRWCLVHGISDANDVLMKLQEAGSERMKNTTLRNPMHLQLWLNAICEPEDAHTADNSVRVYCWLGYAGLSADDAVSIRADEVDFQKQIILHHNREYPIYRESLAAMHNCVELGAFRRQRVDSDILIRGVRGIPSVLSMRAELTRKKKRLIGTPMEQMDISYGRIWLSGVFYRMYEDEQAGIPVDFLSAADAQLNDLKPRSTRAGAIPDKKRRELAKEYRIDYERWKQTLII